MHADIWGKGILLVRSTIYDTLHVKEGDMSGSPAGINVLKCSSIKYKVM